MSYFRGQLGNAVSDLKSILLLVPGGGDVDQKLADFEAYLKELAQEGAQEGAKQVIQPYIMALGALSLGALVFAYTAYKRTKPKASAAVSGLGRRRR